MIPNELWLTTPLPKGVRGQLLVRLSINEVQYEVVNGACPQCKLGPRMRHVSGWMFLHEQPAKAMNLSLAEPSTPILKNAVEAKTGLPGAVIQRCPHCAYGAGPKPFFQPYGQAPNTWECPACAGLFNLIAQPVRIEPMQDCPP